MGSYLEEPFNGYNIIMIITIMMMIMITIKVHDFVYKPYLFSQNSN